MSAGPIVVTATPVKAGPPAVALEYPRFRVFVDGTEWPNVVHGTIELSGLNLAARMVLTFSYADSGKTDEFGFVQPTSPLGKLLALPTSGKALRHYIDIYGGYVDDPITSTPSLSQLTNLASGIIDRVRMDLTRDEVILECRDRSAILLETATFAEFRNQTVKQVIEEIASNAGLKTTDDQGNSTIQDSGTRVGTVYDYEQISPEALPSAGYNDWTILSKFADFDTYIVYIQGNTLHYRPYESPAMVVEYSVGSETQAPNISHLEMTRNFTTQFGRIGFEVASSQLKTKESVLATAGAIRGGGPFRGDSAIYRVVLPNTDHTTALYYAEALALIYTQFEFLSIIHTVGTPEQTPLNGYVLSGTNTQHDRQYRIVRSLWQFGTEVGWQAEVEGLAVPPGEELKVHRTRPPRGFPRLR